MNEIYVFGHRNPDTDSVTSAIALSYLKNQQGLKAKPYILDSLNTESEFVLKYFGVKTPKILNDVKLRIEDIEYYKDFHVYRNVSIVKAYKYIKDNKVTAVPVVSEDKKLLGLVTLKTISDYVVNEEISELKTSYNNILNAIEGKKVLEFDKEINGNILVGAYKTEVLLNTIKLDPQSIIIMGNRGNIIDYAIENKAKLLIIVGGRELTNEQIEKAKKNKVNIIYTDFDAYHTTKIIGLCNNIEELLYDARIESINQKDYLETLYELSSKQGYNNYPVIDDNGKCKGLIRMTDIRKISRKQVILVDHNESKQSVSGLEESEIVEIVDHHKIGDLTTNKPINFRNMSVGSTNTIVYLMFNEARIDIPVDIAGLMFSGIISDTLNFTSPTTTQIDIDVANKLAQIAELDKKKYAEKMFKEGTNLKGKTIEHIITTDLKVFQKEEEKIVVSQVLTLSAEEILKQKDEYIKEMERVKEAKGYSMFVLFITDIIKKGSFMLYCEDSKIRLERAMDRPIEQGMFLEGVLSRKKQIMPKIMKII